MAEHTVRKVKNGLWIKTTKLGPEERSMGIDILEYDLIPGKISISSVPEFADIRVEASNDGAKFYEIFKTNPNKSDLHTSDQLPPARIYRLFNASKKSKIEKIAWILQE